MVLIDKFINLFCNRVAVVNKNESVLLNEVEILKKNFGRWIKVHGFSNYKQLFLSFHLFKTKKHPFSIIFIKNDEPPLIEMILKREMPGIIIYKYSDIRNMFLNL